MKVTLKAAAVARRKRKISRRSPTERPASRLHQHPRSLPSAVPETVDVEFNILGNPTILKLDPRQFAANTVQLLEDFERRHNAMLINLERRLAHLEDQRGTGTTDMSAVLAALRERLS